MFTGEKSGEPTPETDRWRDDNCYGASNHYWDFNWFLDVPMNDLVERLRTKARLIRDWEAFELGGKVPSRLGYLQTAVELSVAADEIERLRSALTPSESKP